MKKFLSFFLLMIISFSVFSTSVEAATLASLTAKRDGQSHSVTFTGNGKYMRIKCAHNKPPTSSEKLGTECKLEKDTLRPEVPLVEWFLSDPSSKEGDVFLSKGVKYRLHAVVYPYSLAGTTITATIYDK